jgi:solute carrier family 35 protein
MMWCNGVMTAPAVLASTMATGELAAVGTFRRLGEFSFEAVVVASCALAFALNYAVFLNTSLNSALTQTICGNLKDVVVIVLGFNAFGGVAVNAVNACGVAVGLCASFRYATLKFKVR